MTRNPLQRAGIGALAATTLALAAGMAFVGAGPNTDLTLAADTPVTVMAAGDIASSGTSTMANATATGDLIRAASPSYALPLGDNAYNDGTLSQYQTEYDPTWGSFKSITRPVPGNHEYHANPPQGYLDYFGRANVTNPQDGGLYYAYDVGNGWRAYALNATGSVSTSAGSAQETWLKADLAAHPGMHYIGYLHYPRYNSGTVHGQDTSQCPLWNALMGAGADVMLAGHDHSYERWTKQDCNGNASATGIREFKVGSGGNQLYPAGSAPANLEVRNTTDYGVLKLTLHENSYDWAFIGSGRCWNGSTSVDCTANKGKVLDSGSAATNRTISVTGAPAPTTTAPASPTTTTTAPVASPSTTTAVASPTSTTSSAPAPAPATSGAPLHYANNPAGQYAQQAALGYNLFDTGMSAGTIDALPSGGKALVWTDEGDCPPATLSTAFRNFVTANASNPRVYGYYLADEPDSTSQGCIDAIKARADFIHAANPDQKAFVLLTDYPGTYAAYSPASAHVDLVGLDPYPCRWDIGTDGGCDYTMIETELARAAAAGVPQSAIVPMFQTFGDSRSGTWKPPTATELQAILAEWQEYLPSPAIDLSYTWSINYANQTDVLSNRSDWQDVMQAYISGQAASAAQPTSPTPTTTTTSSVPAPAPSTGETSSVPSPTATSSAPSPTATSSAPSPTATSSPTPTCKAHGRPTKGACRSR